jgi:maltose alpha-D-glucosyltransferase/alpha-amylase
LTLEMVTDEERDYMYRVYAADKDQRINVGIRRRLAPLLGNDRRRIELLNALLFALPGTPVLYYGDEIGMGDNFYLGDRNGVRTPMQWSADKNAGFSRTNPQRLYLPVIVDPEYHYEAVNVEAQQGNPHSLLWWTRRIIALRKLHPAFSRGTAEFLQPDNHRVLAFLRRTAEETLLVAANLSRFSQYFELDLSPFAGLTPVELFGRSAFPKIGAPGYGLTLGPHSFLWFALVADPAQFGRARQAPKSARRDLEAALLDALGRTARAVEITEEIPVGDDARIALLGVDSTDGETEIYALPLSSGPGEGSGALLEPAAEAGFARALLAAFERSGRFRGPRSELVAIASPAFPELRGEGELEPAPLPGGASVRYGDRLVLKLYRRLEAGVHPDLEIGRFLTERTDFRHIPRVAGWLELRRRGSEPVTLGILREFIPNEGDAWSYTLDALGRYFERVLTDWHRTSAAVPAGSLIALAEREMSADDFERIGTYVPRARLLGERTAELHIALASGGGKEFEPERFSELYQRSLYDSMRSLTKKSLRLLRQRLAGLPEAVRGEAEWVLAAEERILERFHRLTARRLAAERIRTHGDYHLGQVLFTGRDFAILNFEGEPSRSLSERRLKRCPLRDVAGMLRSFQYAAYGTLFEEASAGVTAPESLPALESWALYWERWVSAAFLQAYLRRAQGAGFLPPSRGEREILLDAYLLEKALQEMSYELDNRPGWLRIPLRGIRQILTGEG